MKRFLLNSALTRLASTKTTRSVGRHFHPEKNGPQSHMKKSVVHQKKSTQGHSKEKKDAHHEEPKIITKKRERWLRYTWSFLFFGVPVFLVWDESQDVERVVEAIEKGSGVQFHEQVMIAPVNLIDRSNSIEKIQHIIKPKKQKGPEMTTFCVITGSTGSGKTTLIEQVAKEMGERFVFIQFDNKGSRMKDHIIQRYAKVLNYHPLMNEEDLPFWKPFLYKLQSSVARKTQSNILSVMKKACGIIQERDIERQQVDPNYIPRVPVFCFDNINALVDDNLETLLDQFEASKDATDKRLYASIYTLNDAKTFHILEDEEGFSRVNQQIEVRDVNYDTAKEYMKEEMILGEGCTVEDIDMLVEQCCGGHLLSIQSMIFLRNSRGLNAEQLVAYDVHKISLRASKFNLGRKHPTRYAAAVWNLLYRLYVSETGALSEDEAKEALQLEVDKENMNMKWKEELVEEILDEMISKNLISRDLLSNSVRFHHNTVRTYVRNQISVHEIKLAAILEESLPKDEENEGHPTSKK